MAYTSTDQTTKRTTTLSLRIDSELYEKLKNESDKKTTSINSLVIGTIQKHLVWDIFANELGFTSMSKKTVRQLFEQISEKGNFTEKEAASLMKQIISASAYSHNHYVVHRDLKPENILLDDISDTPIIKVIDWGGGIL